MHRLDILDKNRKTVVGSAIVALAAMQCNGRIEHIVVFQESTRHEFYWIFRSDREDDPRHAWKFAGYRVRDAGMGDFRPYSDFHSFVDHYAGTQKAEVLYVRVLDARRLAAMQAKANHDSICADWSEQDMRRASATQQNKRLASKIRGRIPWGR